MYDDDLDLEDGYCYDGDDLDYDYDDYDDFIYECMEYLDDFA